MLDMDINRAKCMFCSYGHMTECHYPNTCNSDACHHYDYEPDYDDQMDYDESGEPIL